MNLIEFLDSHDKAISAMNNVISIVGYANSNRDDDVIIVSDVVTEVVEELATVKHHIKELETLFLTRKEDYGDKTND